MNSRRTRTITLNHQGRGPQDSTPFWTTWLPKPALNSLLAWDNVYLGFTFSFLVDGEYTLNRRLLEGTGPMFGNHGNRAFTR